MKLIIILLLLLSSCGDLVRYEVSWKPITGQGVEYYTVYRDNVYKTNTLNSYAVFYLPKNKYCFEVSATNIVGESGKSDMVCLEK